MAIILDTDVIIRGEKGTFDLHRASQLATFNRHHSEHIRGLNLVAL